MVIVRHRKQEKVIEPEAKEPEAAVMVKEPEPVRMMKGSDELELSASAGTNDLKFKKVKAQWELEIHHLSGYNDTSICSLIRVGYWNGHRYEWIISMAYPFISETVGFHSLMIIGEGMYPIIRFEGCANGDDIFASLNATLIKKVDNK